MKSTNISWVAILCLLTMVSFALVSAGSAHSHMFRTPPAQTTAASAGPSDTQKANLEAYATLLHENVPDQKEQVLALVLFLNEADAAKFWPIYSQYEAELAKLDATAAASIDDYVKNAGHPERTTSRSGRAQPDASSEPARDPAGQVLRPGERGPGTGDGGALLRGRKPAAIAR